MRNSEMLSAPRILINEALSKSGASREIPEALDPKFVTPIVKYTKDGLVFPRTYAEMYRWIDEMEEGLK